MHLLHPVTAPRERPILFSSPMVRALLAGTKTQTRRVVKGAPEDWSPVQPQVYAPTIVDRHGDEQPGPDAFGAGDAQGDHWIRCPYGQPGDRLWVRETFQRFSEDGEIIYKADKAGFDAMNELKRDEFYEARWRPSIHMPRWASRITLEVTGVKVERLQDISEEDAMAEGIVNAGDDNGYQLADTSHYAGTASESYASLWESINGPGSWDANPLVWAISFKRLEAA